MVWRRSGDHYLKQCWSSLLTYIYGTRGRWVNTLRPRQDGRHFADDIFTCIFFNENSCILIRFSLKYVRKGSIDNNPALVQIMAWRRSGDKPLSEPMMIISPTHICVARPQWVNIFFVTTLIFPSHSRLMLYHHKQITHALNINSTICNVYISINTLRRRCFQMHFLEWKCLNFA